MAGGDTVDVDIELDTAPRTVQVPADLKKRLARNATARRTFDGLSNSRQQRLVLPIEDAKTAETRERRVEKAMSMLRDGTA